MSETVFEMAVFRGPINRTFIRLLVIAHRSLSSSDAADFFTVLLKDRLPEADANTGEQILLSIVKVLAARPFFFPKSSQFPPELVTVNVLELLPYSSKAFVASIWDILFVILDQTPEVFTELVIARFKKIIPRDPYRALVFVASAARSTSQFAVSAPLFDLLFDYVDVFRSADYLPDFIALIVFLYETFPLFRTEKGPNCWDTISSFLKLDDIQILRTVYCGLSRLSDGRMKVSYPLKIITNHLQDLYLQDDALSFLIIRPPSKIDRHFLKQLFELAKSTDKATLILMKLAADPTIAPRLLDNSSWMVLPLPTTEYTVRLFLALFQQRDLRDDISKSRDVIGFLRILVDNASFFGLSLVVLVLKKLPLSSEFVQELGSADVIGKLHLAAQKAKDTSSFLKAIDIIVSYEYIEEYLRVCPEIAREIKTRGDLSEQAAELSLKLCSWQQCVDCFRRQGLVTFYRLKRNDPALAGQAESFLAMVGTAEEEDNANYYSEAESDATSD